MFSTVLAVYKTLGGMTRSQKGTSGKAHGRNRDYQVHCRNVLQQRAPDLRPYSGDGIDVQFSAGGTVWTIDLALISAKGEVVIAECRRRANSTKQGEVGGLAHKAELLRKHLRIPVAGFFFAKTALQLGAVKHGEHEGITTAVLTEGDDSPGFAIAFHRYDTGREDRIRAFVLKVAPAAFGITGGEVTFRVARRKQEGP